MFSHQFWVELEALKQHGVLPVMGDTGRKDGGIHPCLESTPPLSPLTPQPVPISMALSHYPSLGTRIQKLCDEELDKVCPAF